MNMKLLPTLTEFALFADFSEEGLSINKKTVCTQYWLNMCINYCYNWMSKLEAIRFFSFIHAENRVLPLLSFLNSRHEIFLFH